MEDAEVVPIVAMAMEGVIGHEGKLPWRLPEDLRRFREVTTGHPVVMGRKTFDAIGKPLPGRTNIVVTRQPGFEAPEGVLIARSPEEALRIASGLDRTVFVLGGAEVFAATLPHARRILATLVYDRFPGDTFFPLLGDDWHLASREDFRSEHAGPSGALRASFVRLERRAGPDDCALCHLRAGRGLPSGSPWDEGLAALLASLPRAKRAPQR